MGQDLDDMPFSLWGKIKRTVGGDIGLVAKVNTKSGALNKLGVDLQAASASSGTVVQVTGTARTDDLSVSPGTIKVTQTIDMAGVGKFTLVPTYSVASRKTDVKVSYGGDDTVVTIDGNVNFQRVTVSQAFGNNNYIAPSITSDGDICLDYTRSVGTGALTASYKPDDSLALTFEDGPWVATVRAPMSGYYEPSLDSATFSVRRSVDITGPF